MGNLARATYLDTTDHMWPFSTNACNQYTRYSQEINACNDQPGYGMHPNRGRGAPEVDFFEVLAMYPQLPSPLLSASLQVAPGKPNHRPALGKQPNVTWYDPVLRNDAFLNLYFYGTHTYDPNRTVAYQTDSISINYWLNESFYDGPHKYRIEWEPPVEDMDESPSNISRGGYIKWFIDGKLISAIVGDKLQQVSDTEIPSEPMYILLNQALSKDWGFPDAYFLNCEKKCWSCLDPECACAMPLHFCQRNIPATFDIDYVRIYQVQNDARHMLGCSPPSRPTAEWIQGHQDRYVLWRSPKGTPPLQPIQRGGDMACTTSTTNTTTTSENTTTTRAANFCGGDERGYCDPAVGCLCRAGWTGPSCLSPYGYATVDMALDAHPKRKTPSARAVQAAISLLLAFLVVWVGRKIYLRGTYQKNGYDPIPTVSGAAKE